jgi:predicted phage terminase large subunit-like protein
MFVAGEIKRLMVFMPPRHGKSELVSRRLPAYILGRNPNAQIIACSYSADLAQRMNRDTQRIIDDPLYTEIFPDTQLFGTNIRTVARGTYLRNSDIFEIVGHGGCYRSAGVGGGITGMGFNFGIIDDPIKNREEAESRTYRDNLWDWYTSTFYTRQEKAGAILVTLTRWHQDDMAGRLLDLASSDGGEPWEIVRFPAIREEGDNADDPREPGAPLWENKYDLGALASIKAAVGSYQWASLYQQRPTPAEGAMFKRAWFEIVDATPADCQYTRWWDKAGTAKDGDYTAGVLMAYSNGRYYVMDVKRGQWSVEERNRIMLQTAQLDAQTTGGNVVTWTEQEPGSSGKESAEATIRLLAGHAIRAETSTGSKEVRAQPFAAQCEAGNVKLLNRGWNGAYLDELCAFPFGTNDDQVDASSGAFNKLAQPAWLLW